MALTENEIADILQASAHSSRPISKDTLQRIAEECNINPDNLTKTYEDICEVVEALRRDGDEPMPVVLS